MRQLALTCLPIGPSLDQNWVIAFPTVCSVFGNIFYCVAAFGCSSFVFVRQNTVHYGFWGVRENGQCQQIDFVDAPLRLGRAFGLIGTVLGTCFTLFWVSAWTLRYPKHVLHVVAASMATSMMCMGTTLHFMGPATSSCDEQLILQSYWVGQVGPRIRCVLVLDGDLRFVSFRAASRFVRTARTTRNGS
jgi:hypothetical protein